MHLLNSPKQRSRVLDRVVTQSQDFAAAVGNKFIRQGKWGPLQVFLTLCMSHSDSSSKDGIPWKDAIGRLHATPAGEALGWGDTTAAPTVRSFHDARLKLKESNEQVIWNHLMETMHDDESQDEIILGGFRFFHGDGMQFHMQRSEETLREFSVQGNGTSGETHYPQGKLVAFMEGGSGRMIDFKLVRCKDKKNAGASSIPFEEKEAINHFVEQMTPTDCLVWDSGGSSQHLFYDMHAAGKNFIMAIGSDWILAQKFKAKRRAEIIVDHHIPARCLPGVPPLLCARKLEC